MFLKQTETYLFIAMNLFIDWKLNFILPDF